MQRRPRVNGAILAASRYLFVCGDAGLATITLLRTDSDVRRPRRTASDCLQRLMQQTFTSGAEVKQPSWVLLGGEQYT